MDDGGLRRAVIRCISFVQLPSRGKGNKKRLLKTLKPRGSPEETCGVFNFNFHQYYVLVDRKDKTTTLFSTRTIG